MELTMILTREFIKDARHHHRGLFAFVSALMLFVGRQEECLPGDKNMLQSSLKVLFLQTRNNNNNYYYYNSFTALCPGLPG